MTVTRPRRPAAILARGWRGLLAFHDALFESRWRAEIRRDARAQQDTLRALVLLDALGVENPVAYETLDVLPHLLADVHAWHRRMGDREHSLPGVCC